MPKKITSIKHPTDKRVHIPSIEEAGYEDANEKVAEGKKVLELPKNPVVHRGQDPELFWLNKYGNDDRDDLLKVDIRSLYRHEHIAPEALIKNLYKLTETKSDQISLFTVNEMFGNALDKDEIDKVSEYYQHQDGWTNRLIQGDSHLVMASLLEREGMAGQVQTIFMDPPYGIKYGGNWQIKLNNKNVTDGSDEALTGEPEQIKAFRDTWELGIHSYLSYLRDRLLVAKELLTESGSCFVQISDENVHLVRSLMDEIFGSENFISEIVFAKTASITSNYLGTTHDFILWYGKNKEVTKYRQLFVGRKERTDGGTYNCVELEDGSWRRLTKDEMMNLKEIKGRIFRAADISRQGESSKQTPYSFQDKTYYPSKGRHWAAKCPEGMDKLAKLGRIVSLGSVLSYKTYEDDFPLMKIDHVWGDTILGTFSNKLYVVQTSQLPIQRCLLMTTDPGDLVLDPTCGSGTTAYVAEQWGRRWITIDTSRIALNIAKQRIMTAVFPYYKLYDEKSSELGFSGLNDDRIKGDKKILQSSNLRNPNSDHVPDIRQGFIYKTVPHITLKSLANDEPPATETLYDQPEVDKKLLRVSGPFTVETLQGDFEPMNPEDLDNEIRENEEEGAFEEVIKQHLISSGIKNGRKDEMVIFRSVELLAGEALHAEGFYQTARGEEKAYFHIGPKFGTVSKKLVNDAIKECRIRGDANWLVILGFSFESDISGSSQTTSLGTFEVTKCRIHDDLLQEGLKKKPAKSAASFVTIGEPDIALIRMNHRLGGLKDSTEKIREIHKSVKISDSDSVQVEIKGLDIYDPIKDIVKPRDVHDIAYWMIDDDYDGSNFVVKQVFFCGGDKTEFARWKKGLDNLAKDHTRKKVEKTLKIEIDDEAFDRLYGHISHPIEIKKKGQKIAVRIISQFGEESTKVMGV